MSNMQAKHKKSCFIICPIDKTGSATRMRSDKVLDEIVKPVASDLGYEVERSDTYQKPGIINNQIIQLLHDSNLVIADLTGGNPNVFYELGVRDTLGKPEVLMMQEGEIPPFDKYSDRI